MAKMRNWKLQWRVIDAAKTVMASFWGEMDSDRALKILLARPTNLHEVSYDGTLIEQVLTHTDASISEAACSPTLTPERLLYIIEMRPERPAKKRSRVHRHSLKE
jgi:hypothetical protein